MKKAVEQNAYGYNFLHKEVLCNTTEPLTKFKATSVTKKPYQRVVCLAFIHRVVCCMNQRSLIN